MTKKTQINVIELYANYLHALEYFRDCGEMYGDTPEMLRMYEKQLLEYRIKILTKDGKYEQEKVKIKEYKG